MTNAQYFFILSILFVILSRQEKDSATGFFVIVSIIYFIFSLVYLRN